MAPCWQTVSPRLKPYVSIPGPAMLDNLADRVCIGPLQLWVCWAFWRVLPHFTPLPLCPPFGGDVGWPWENSWVWSREEYRTPSPTHAEHDQRRLPRVQDGASRCNGGILLVPQQGAPPPHIILYTPPVESSTSKMSSTTYHSTWTTWNSTRLSLCSTFALDVCRKPSDIFWLDNTCHKI